MKYMLYRRWVSYHSHIAIATSALLRCYCLRPRISLSKSNKNTQLSVRNMTKSSENKYTDPELRDEIKEEVQAGDKGGKPGQWSARKVCSLSKPSNQQVTPLGN